MGIRKPVDVTNCSDDELLTMITRSKDRSAIAELYDRYRVSIGRYLHRNIKSKSAVTYAYNTMMHRIISGFEKKPRKTDVSVWLFSMAYQARCDYMEERVKAGSATIDKQAKTQPWSGLPNRHKDVLELLYQHNFSFDQVANIVGCTGKTVRHCWSDVSQLGTAV